MKYRIRLNSDRYKTRKSLDILACMLPFSILANREKDVLAIYIDEYIRLSNKGKLTKEEIFALLFDYNFTLQVSNELSTDDKPVSMDSVRNYITRLRKKGLLYEQTINDDFIKLFANIGNSITFVFEIKN